MGLGWSKPKQPEGRIRTWHRDNFFLTTDKTYLDVDVVNDIFRSDLMWWNDPLEPSQMKKMLDNCLTLGLYWVPESAEQMESMSRPLPHPSVFLFVFDSSRSCLMGDLGN